MHPFKLFLNRIILWRAQLPVLPENLWYLRFLAELLKKNLFFEDYIATENIDDVANVINQVAHCVDTSALQIKLIVMLWILGDIVVDQALDPVY